MANSESKTTDTDRLDWLEQHGLSAKCDWQGLWHIAPGLAVAYHALAELPPTYPTMREAIDAAMASGKWKPVDKSPFVTDIRDPRLGGGVRFQTPKPDPKYSFWNGPDLCAGTQWSDPEHERNDDE